MTNPETTKYIMSPACPGGDPRFQGSGSGPMLFGAPESEFSILKEILTELRAIRALLETRNDAQP